MHVWAACKTPAHAPVQLALLGIDRVRFWPIGATGYICYSHARSGAYTIGRRMAVSGNDQRVHLQTVDLGNITDTAVLASILKSLKR